MFSGHLKLFHLWACLFVACWYIQEGVLLNVKCPNCGGVGGLQQNLVAVRGTGGMATTKERPVNGYCSICIWFPAGRRAEIRAQK